MRAIPPCTIPPLEPRLRRIEVPTAVVWGASGRIVGPSYGRTLAALIPGASFEEIPEAGHLPQLERPDAVAAAIRTLG